MSEKEKPKRGSRYGILRSCLIFSLYPLLVLTLLAGGLIYWAVGGYVKSSLDPQYIPTAEYLLESPFQYDAFPPISATDAHLDLRVSLIDWNQVSEDLMDGTFKEGQVCFAVVSGFDEDFQNVQWAEIYINEQVIGRFHPGIPEGTTDSIPATGYICFDGQLNSGLHIIEFRAKENPFSEPYYIHRWTVEIP